MTRAQPTRYKCDLFASFINHSSCGMKLARRSHLYRVGCARVISCSVSLGPKGVVLMRGSPHVEVDEHSVQTKKFSFLSIAFCYICYMSYVTGCFVYVMYMYYIHDIYVMYMYYIHDIYVMYMYYMVFVEYASVCLCDISLYIYA